MDFYYIMPHRSVPSPGFYILGKVFHEDTATVESLVAAVRLHRRDAYVHLGNVYQ